MHVLLVSREYYHVDLLHALMTIMYLFIQLNEACSIHYLVSLPRPLFFFDIAPWARVKKRVWAARLFTTCTTLIMKSANG